MHKCREGQGPRAAIATLCSLYPWGSPLCAARFGTSVAWLRCPISLPAKLWASARTMLLTLTPVGASRASKQGRGKYASTGRARGALCAPGELRSARPLRGAQGTAQLLRGEATGRAFFSSLFFARTKKSDPGGVGAGSAPRFYLSGWPLRASMRSRGICTSLYITGAAAPAHPAPGRFGLLPSRGITTSLYGTAFATCRKY
jgi:hypothetical protein